MKLIFIGPQGSGKGTQAKIIANKLNLEHISAGDLLRSATGELKKEIESHINFGNFVPDKLILKLLKQKLDRTNNFILDGFPRNITQVKELDKITKIDKIIEIEISDSEAIKRLSSRISCEKCGESYNLMTNPPKQKNICDKCKTKLTQRKDDTPESIKKRLEIYHKETEPILKNYPSIKINGEQKIKDVTGDILKELEK